MWIPHFYIPKGSIIIPNNKHKLLKLIHRSGGNAASRFLLRHKPRIVMLHNVITERDTTGSSLTVDMLSAMFQAIAQHHTPLSFQDYLELQRTPGSCPKNAVILTFDDGYKSFYDLVFPLLKKFNIPATVFVCPRLIDEQSCIWPDKLAALYAHGYQGPQGQDIQDMLAELKLIDSQKRNEFLADASASLGDNASRTIPAVHQLMNWSMLQELAQSHLVEIGSHTQTHPILAHESEAVSKDEIAGSKERLEQMLGLPIKTFCYPNGQLADYTPDQTLLVKEAGYIAAVASHYGLVEPSSDRFALPRIGGDDHQSTLNFFKSLDGIEHFQHKILARVMQKDAPSARIT